MTEGGYYTITAWFECNMKIYLHEKIHYEFSSANKFSYCTKISAVIVLLHD